MKKSPKSFQLTFRGSSDRFLSDFAHVEGARSRPVLTGVDNRRELCGPTRDMPRSRRFRKRGFCGLRKRNRLTRAADDVTRGGQDLRHRTLS